jgi:tight adherence protein C
MSLPLLIAAGGGFAIGLILLLVSLRQRPLTLVEALQRAATPRLAATATANSTLGRGDQILASLGHAIGIDRFVNDTARRDLRALDVSIDAHVARSLLTALELGIIVPAFSGVLALGGVNVPVAVPAGVTVLLAIVGAVLPTALLHRDAEERRRSYRHALGAYFDLVGVNIAAGKGVEGALETAAAAGQGPMFAELRQALYRAKIAGQAPWAGLDRLGDDIGITELRELAGTATLAGDVGARVRESLAAKARTLRARGLAQIEESANSANEKMSLPVVLLVVSFIVLIGYPAVYRISHGL